MVYLNYRLDTILCYYPGCSNIKQCCYYHSGQLRYTILFQNDIFYRGSYNKLSQHIYILFFHRLNLMHLTPMHIMQVSTDHINTKVNIHFPHSFRLLSPTLLQSKLCPASAANRVKTLGDGICSSKLYPKESSSFSQLLKTSICCD